MFLAVSCGKMAEDSTKVWAMKNRLNRRVVTPNASREIGQGQTCTGQLRIRTFHEFPGCPGPKLVEKPFSLIVHMSPGSLGIDFL